MFLKLLLCYFVGINFITFLLFIIDKRQAKLGFWRISEKALLIGSALGGAMGALFSMKWFRHKTKKSSFIIFYIGTVFLNFVYLYLLFIYRKYLF